MLRGHLASQRLQKSWNAFMHVPVSPAFFFDISTSEFETGTFYRNVEHEISCDAASHPGMMDPSATSLYESTTIWTTWCSHEITRLCNVTTPAYKAAVSVGNAVDRKHFGYVSCLCDIKSRSRMMTFRSTACKLKERLASLPLSKFQVWFFVLNRHSTSTRQSCICLNLVIEDRRMVYCVCL